MSISNQEAVDAISEHVRNDPEAEIPSHRMAKLVEMIFNMNHSEFNTKLYLQSLGTPIILRTLSGEDSLE